MTGDAGLIGTAKDPLKKRAAIVILALIAVGMVPFLFHRGALIDHILAVYTIGAALTGAVFGCFLSAWVGPLTLRESGFRGILLILAIPIIAIVIATFYARMVVETIAFTGVNATISELKAPITGKNAKWSASFDLAPEPGSRTMIVRVTSEAYAQAEPYRQPGRDCLLVKIETGRGGVRRMLVPNLLDASIEADRVVPCHS